jgi:hypothetical protein
LALLGTTPWLGRDANESFSLLRAIVSCSSFDVTSCYETPAFFIPAAVAVACDKPPPQQQQQQLQQSSRFIDDDKSTS